MAAASSERLAEATPPAVEALASTSADVSLADDGLPELRLADAERRRRDRRTLAGEVTIRNVTPGRLGPFLAAEMLDACADGLALRVSLPARPGDRLCLRVPDGRQAMELMCTVRYCRPERGRFILGCGIGTGWGDALGHAMLPPELARRRSA